MSGFRDRAALANSLLPTPTVMAELGKCRCLVMVRLLPVSATTPLLDGLGWENIYDEQRIESEEFPSLIEKVGSLFSNLVDLKAEGALLQEAYLQQMIVRCVQMTDSPPQMPTGAYEVILKDLEVPEDTTPQAFFDWLLQDRVQS